MYSPKTLAPTLLVLSTDIPKSTDCKMFLVRPSLGGRRLSHTLVTSAAVAPHDVHHFAHDVLSSTPRVYLLHDFLTAHECRALMAVGKPLLQRSNVVVVEASPGYQATPLYWGEGKRISLRRSANFLISPRCRYGQRCVSCVLGQNEQLCLPR